MSMYLYDADGYVGDLASNNGLAALFTYLRSDEEDYPKLAAFANNGFAVLDDDFKRELEDVPLPASAATADTLKNLRLLVAKAKEIAIASDGVEEETNNTPEA